MERIEKSIYSMPGITRHLRPQPACYILIALGAVCGWLLNATQTSSQWLEGLYLLLLGTGAFSLLLLMCYYLFGDSRRPYYKPGKKLLEPEYFYFNSGCKDALLHALDAKDEDAICRIKRTSIPELVMVHYSDEAGCVIYAQLQESRGGELVPISNIVSIIK
ncbi:MAG: hypothetical protein SPJ13_05195 [Bacteroidales bacterium]|nr:hypothetical protein [Bacteroidales bacterium]